MVAPREMWVFLRCWFPQFSRPSGRLELELFIQFKYLNNVKTYEDKLCLCVVYIECYHLINL